MKPEVITLVGASCTGKTSLCNALAAHYRQQGAKVETVQSIVRSSGITTINEQATPRSQLRIYAAFIDAHQIMFNNGNADFVIMERTIIDPLAYTAVIIERAINMTHYDQDRYARDEAILHGMQMMAPPLIKRYNHVFYMPPNIPLDADAYRSRDPIFRQDVDRKILEYLRTFGVKHMPLSGPVEDRVEAVTRKVSTPVLH